MADLLIKRVPLDVHARLRAEAKTAYDAQYIALARSLSILCLTEDRRLLRACPRTAVSLKDFQNDGIAPLR